VRVYAESATLDAVSNGRAQLIVGRGSLTESFSLFGFDLADYELFEEKLDLLMRLIRDQPVTWSGTVRSPLTDQYVSPPLPEGHLPTWVGVGGTPQSVIRAAPHSLPLMLAVIGRPPRRFTPHVDLYRRALEEFGHPRLPIGMHSIGFVAKTDEEAVDIQWPYWAEMMEASAGERGWARPTKNKFQAKITGGSLLVGSPETVATKLAASISCSGSVDSTWRTPSDESRTNRGCDDRTLWPRGDPARARVARHGSRQWRRDVTRQVVPPARASDGSRRHETVASMGRDHGDHDAVDDRLGVVRCHQLVVEDHPVGE